MGRSDEKKALNSLKMIARVQSDFPTKFGIPRQSGVVKELRAAVVFEPEYRNPDALRGMDEFSHIWLIWGFSEAQRSTWAPTVRPPRLGGNARMGVFATRSPYRPNAIGLSCVALESVETHASLGPILHIDGADMMDGTPVYDIKPYLPYADCRPEATGGFAAAAPQAVLQVEVAEKWLQCLPVSKRQVLREVLAQDPRPPYQQDTGRVYGMEFAECEVKFVVAGKVLTVVSIEKHRGL